MTAEHVEVYVRLIMELMALPYGLYRLCLIEKNTRRPNWKRHLDSEKDRS